MVLSLLKKISAEVASAVKLVAVIEGTFESFREKPRA